MLSSIVCLLRDRLKKRGKFPFIGGGGVSKGQWTKNHFFISLLGFSMVKIHSLLFTLFFFNFQGGSRPKSGFFEPFPNLKWISVHELKVGFLQYEPLIFLPCIQLIHM